MVLKATLDRCVAAADKLHTQIYDSLERGSQEMTVYEEIPLFLKLRLKDKLPPVTLRFIS